VQIERKGADVVLDVIFCIKGNRARKDTKSLVDICMIRFVKRVIDLIVLVENNPDSVLIAGNERKLEV
jgi:hypothetical protein